MPVHMTHTKTKKAKLKHTNAQIKRQSTETESA